MPLSPNPGSIDQSPDRRWRWRLLLCLYLLGLALALLAPFDFYRPWSVNQAMLQADGKGLRFSDISLVQSEMTPKRLYDRLVAGSGLSLDVWVMTASLDQKGPARIISYSQDQRLRNFTLGQKDASLVMRIRTSATDLNGLQTQLVVPGVFTPNRLQHLVMTYDFSVQRLYVDGQLRFSTRKTQGRFTNWDSSYPLVLGNEATGNRPWRGAIQLVSIYDRPLAESEVQTRYESGVRGHHETGDGLVAQYDFLDATPALIPDQSGQTPPIQLTIPWLVDAHRRGRGLFMAPQQNFSFSLLYFRDVVGNVLLFIPMGFLCCRVMTRRHKPPAALGIAGMILFGCLYSVLLESIQFTLVSRVSSVTDVLCNTLGTIAGISIFRKWQRPTAIARAHSGFGS